MGDVYSLDEKLEALRQEVGERFDRVHDDLKELTKALRDLIRIDGDIRRLQDAVGRIGRETEDHEKRLRVLEQAGVGTRVKLSAIDRLQMLALTAGSSVLTAMVVYLLTRHP